MSELEDRLFHLKLVLEETVKFPTEYYFKFIVPLSGLAEITFVLDGAIVDFKPSSGGKYISVSAKKIVANSDEVIVIYQRAGAIKGIISL